MALIPLQAPRWSWDDQRNRLIAEFVEAPPPDAADPASWEPEFTYTAEFNLPQAPNKKPRAGGR